ncbi:o-succinylbenzoate--CoA ligase [Vibrio sonorensis]|uniref:o-succinylbenzoate--CoA ligase n=1 Tax=Vibrio sonorensis TaxID=1004316 RepID=UPI0008DA4823|nr:o-succinylbenzoate--CoA ligase [Vibrio sonorensis]
MQWDSHPVRVWAQSHPDKLALITPQKNYTWQTLDNAIDQLAQSLEQKGIGNGSLITAIGKNSVDLLLLILACHRISAMTAVTMPRPDSELETCLNTLYSPQQPRWIWSSQADVCRWRQRVKSSNPQSSYKVSSPATITFTSGSSGTPKAVLHTHQQHFASASGLLEPFSFNKGDTWLLSLPLYHVSGLAIVYRWLLAGACLKIGEGDLSIDIQGVSHASLVPTQLSRLMTTNATDRLKRVLLGGANIPLELCEQASARNIDTWLGYGMTEMASTITAKRYDGLKGVGGCLPKRELTIKDSQIYVRGDTLAEGYYHQGKINPLIDKEGWFCTGDLGEWLNDQLVIKGRTDNQFISGGENIHCEEIEGALMSIPEIGNALVLPQPDADYGYRPVAYVDWVEQPLSKSKIESILAKYLVKFKWPVEYYLIPETLLASGIKVSRKALIEHHESQG